MAITVNTLTPVPSSQAGPFALNATSADLSGCEELLAAPTGGKSIYVERIVVNCTGAINITIGEGETTSAVTTVRFGPLYLAANSSITIDLKRPVKLTAETALTVDGSGSGATTIVVEGFVQ